MIFNCLFLLSLSIFSFFVHLSLIQKSADLRDVRALSKIERNIAVNKEEWQQTDKEIFEKTPDLLMKPILVDIIGFKSRY